jgi:hypothetical protein
MNISVSFTLTNDRRRALNGVIEVGIIVVSAARNDYVSFSCCSESLTKRKRKQIEFD